jgi:hypothetical protein
LFLDDMAGGGDAHHGDQGAHGEEREARQHRGEAATRAGRERWGNEGEPEKINGARAPCQVFFDESSIAAQ